MPARLSIFQKGIVLIAAPLLMQLGLIALVYNSQSRQVEAQHWTAHTKEVLAQANHILILLADEESSLRGFVITGNPAFADPFVRANQKLPVALENLRSLVADNPAQESRARSIAAKATTLADWHSNVVEVVREGARERAIDSVKKGVGKNQMDAIRQEANAFIVVEEGLDHKRQSNLLKTQQRLTWLLGAGTLVSFLGMSALLLLFNRGIGGRLTMLTENARRLADGKELTENIEGNDEIAALDRAFHESARKLADSQKAIREEKELLNAVLNSMGEGLIVADAQGKFLLFNPAAKLLLGRGPEGTLPERWTEDFGVYLTDAKTPFPPEDLPLTRALRNESVDNIEQAIRSNHRPEPIWITVSARPLPGPNGRPSGGVAVFRDVTQRRKAEESIRQLNLDLERRVEQRTAELTDVNRDLAQKNQENEMFVYSVSHDLRSPLVSLQGFSKELGLVGQELRALLTTDAIPDETRSKASAILEGDMQQSLRFIQAGVVRLSNIIDALLRLSRVGRVEYDFRELDTSAIVNGVVAAMSGELLDRNVDVRIAALPACWGDATAVEQLFANLIGNALKYLDSKRPGAIEVGAVSMDQNADGEGNPPTVTFYVRDNGLGIPAAYQEKIFQVFQRVHIQHAPGEGLGLSIVRRIVQRHRGRVWVESTEGQGSTFFVSLPSQILAGGVPSAKKCSQEGGHSNGERTHGHFVGGRR